MTLGTLWEQHILNAYGMQAASFTLLHFLREQFSSEQQARLPAQGVNSMHWVVSTPQVPAESSHKTYQIMTVLPFSGKRVQAFIQLPKGL